MERKKKDCEENTGKFKCDCKEVLTYGFFLRFAKQNYIPCDKCQGRLHSILMKHKWNIKNNELIGLTYQPMFKETPSVSFDLLFLTMSKWTPCDTCQKYLMNIIRKSELILGHKEYTDPPVELWRKWKLKD